MTQPIILDEKDDYAIEPFTYGLIFGTGAFSVGDIIDIVTGDVIVGSYCSWPKQKPRQLIVIDEVSNGPMKYPTIKESREEHLKFYQKLNKKRWG